MKHYFIRLNRSEVPILLHPCENVPFKSREDAEQWVEELKSKGEFHISEHQIVEAQTLSIDLP